MLLGQHGDEHTPLKIGIDLISFLKTQLQIHEQKQLEQFWSIFSEIIIINGVNLDAIRSQTRYIKLSEEQLYDLNRQYISNINKSLLYIKSLVEQCDLILDIHSSLYVNNPFVAITKDQYTNSLIEFCNQIHMDYLITPQNSNPGTLKEYSLSFNQIKSGEKIGFLSTKKIKIGFTIETNGINQIYQNKNDLQLIKNILNNIGFLYLTNECCKYSEPILICPNKEGLYISNNISRKCKPKQELGRIYSLMGELIDVVTTENVSGLIIESSYSKYCTTDSWIAVINQYLN